MEEVVIDVDNVINSDKLRRLIGVEEGVVVDSNDVIAGVVIVEDMAVDVAETIANGWQTNEGVVVAALMSVATVDHQAAVEAAGIVETSAAVVEEVVTIVTDEMIEVAEEVDSETGIFGMATATAMEAISTTPIAGCHKEKRMTRK